MSRRVENGVPVLWSRSGSLRSRNLDGIDPQLVGEFVDGGLEGERAGDRAGPPHVGRFTRVERHDAGGGPDGG